MSDLILDQGATWERVWTYCDANGSPLDLTGAQAAFQARWGGPEGPLALDLDSGAKGGVAVGGATGAITITVPAALSSALVLALKPQASVTEDQGGGLSRTGAGAICVWALELTHPGGHVERIDEGRMAITREVVR